MNVFLGKGIIHLPRNTQWFVYSRDIIDNMRKCLLNRSKVPLSKVTKLDFLMLSIN